VEDRIPFALDQEESLRNKITAKIWICSALNCSVGRTLQHEEEEKIHYIDETD
jgi:hypothetical protein